MANLKIEVILDGADEAAKKLDAIEKKVGGVEDAAEKSASKNVILARSLKDVGEESNKTAVAAGRLHGAHANTEASAVRAAAASRNLSTAQTLAASAATSLGLSSTRAASGIGIMQGAMAALGTASMGTFAIITAGATAVLGFIGILAKSTLTYFQNSKATEDSRRALDSLSATWERFQMTIGRAVLGDNFSIVRPITLLNVALETMSMRLAAGISFWKEFAGAVGGGLGGAIAGTVLSNPKGFNAQAWAEGNLKYGTGSNEGVGFLNPFAPRGPDLPTFGPNSMQLFQMGEERAREQAKAQAQQAQQIAQFNSWISDYRGGGIGRGGGVSGFPGGMPGTELPLPFAPFHYGGMPMSAGFDLNAISPISQIMYPGSSAFTAPKPPPGFGGRFGGGFMGGLGNVLMSGLQGGGIGGMMSGLASLGGSSLGGAIAGGFGTAAGSFGASGFGKLLGGMLPGIGSMLGPLLGGLFGKLFGPTGYEKRVRAENAERADIRAGFQADRGSYESMAAFTGRGDLLQQFNNVQNSAAPEYLRQLLGDLESRTERLQRAMDKYGISWEQLGEKAKQAKITDMAAEFIQDFEVLNQAGMSTQDIMQAMSGSVNEFLQTAVRTGTEVPQAMRPMLQSMLDMGLLTDAAGNKLEDLSSVTFSDALPNALKSIAEAIDHLAKALGYTADTVAAAAPGSAGASGSPGGPGSGGGYEAPEEGEGGYPSPYGREAYHNGGWVRMHRGGLMGDERRAILQAGEFVMSRADVARAGGPGVVSRTRGAGGGGVAKLYLDGRQVAEAVFEHIPAIARDFRAGA